MPLPFRQRVELIARRVLNPKKTTGSITVPSVPKRKARNDFAAFLKGAIKDLQKKNPRPGTEDWQRLAALKEELAGLKKTK